VTDEAESPEEVNTYVTVELLKLSINGDRLTMPIKIG